jgi:NADH-quinone oxidoreductase subunit J
MANLLFFQTDDPSRLEALGQFLAAYGLVLLPAALGLVAIYWLLPRARGSKPLLGAILGAAALLLAGALLVRIDMVLPETLLFYAFSGLAILGGGLLITQTNPVKAALSFALVILSTCGLFLLQAAPFLMAATIIVYAGAIVVTFLFVIMLAQQAGMADADQRSREPFLSSLAGFVLMGAILCVLQRNYDTSRLDDYLEKTRQAAEASTIGEARQILGDPEEFVSGFQDEVERTADSRSRTRNGSPSALRQELHTAIPEIEHLVQAGRHTELKIQLRRIHELGIKVRYAQGSLQPSERLPVSKFSGTPATAGPPAPDEEGKVRERLPARNVAALGRSLFTDYLLAVELAGLLLTVASIGAIAIAGRGKEGLR